MLAVLRLYFRATGNCLSYLPDLTGACRVCGVGGDGYPSRPVQGPTEGGHE